MFRSFARVARVGVAASRGASQSAAVVAGARTFGKVAAATGCGVAAVGVVGASVALCESQRIPAIPRWGVPGTAQERTFIALKPDAVQRVGLPALPRVLFSQPVTVV